MYLSTVPVIDQLIAERRIHTGYPRSGEAALMQRIADLEQEATSVCCGCCCNCYDL